MGVLNHPNNDAAGNVCDLMFISLHLPR